MTSNDMDRKLEEFKLNEFVDDLMKDETLVPQFFVARGLAIPVLDEEGKENSWQNLLKRHQ